MTSPFSRIRSRFLDYWETKSAGEQSRLIAGAIFILIVIIAFPIWKLGKPLVQSWQHDQAMSKAREYAEAEDYRNMLLSLQRASQLAPSDPATWKEISAYLAKLGLRETLMARENVLKLDPSDMANRIELATDAIRFGQSTIAQSVLEGADEKARNTTSYQRIATTLAILLGDNQSMFEHLQQLVALVPTDTEARLNLALLSLLRGGKAGRDEAVADLTKLLASPDVQVRAAIELLKDAARQRDPTWARDVLDLILSNLPPDTLKAGDYTLDDLVSALKTHGAAQAGDVVVVANWLASIRRASEALAWVDSLPADLRQDPAIRKTSASLVLKTDDLHRAEAMLVAGDFGTIGSGPVILALAARQQSLLGKTARAKSTWTDAVELAAQNGIEPTRTLSEMAMTWSEPDWLEIALQQIIQTQNNAFWAYAALRDLYFNTGKTRELWELTDRWVKFQGDNEQVVLTWIRAGCALPVMPDSLKQHADGILTDLKDSPAKHLARAIWLFRQKKLEDAKLMLNRVALTPEQMPGLGFWRYIIITALDPYSSERYDTSDNLLLLPEEMALLPARLRLK